MTDKKKTRAQEYDPVWQGANKQGDYEVGYGKPPKSTRFKKGQSGNPRGRPRKAKPRPLRLSDAPSERIFEEEIYRPVKLRENGKEIELSTIQAVTRSQTTSAIKGNRLAQKEVIARAERLEREKQDQKIARYVELKQYKERGEKIISECAKKDKPIPKLLPHPEDIFLNPVTGDACINGPETEADERYYETAKLMRDHMLLMHVDAKKSKKGLKLEHEGEQFCAYAIFAHTMDLTMPKRFRWVNYEDSKLIREYEDLPKKARLAKISRDRKCIEKARQTNSRITPDIQRELDRISKEWLSG